MRSNVEHNQVLHEHVVVLSITTLPVPFVPEAERVAIDDLGHTDDGITHVEAGIGYMDAPDVPQLLALAVEAGMECPVDVETATYYLSTIDLEAGDRPGLARWRKNLFVATSLITADAARYFNLPRDRTIIMGSRITI